MTNNLGNNIAKKVDVRIYNGATSEILYERRFYCESCINFEKCGTNIFRWNSEQNTAACEFAKEFGIRPQTTYKINGTTNTLNVNTRKPEHKGKNALNNLIAAFSRAKLKFTKKDENSRH